MSIILLYKKTLTRYYYVEFVHVSVKNYKLSKKDFLVGEGLKRLQLAQKKYLTHEG